MRSMGSPGYVYRPRSPEVREKLSEIHHRRLGNLPGCARLYGLQVPRQFAKQVRDDAAWIANNIGWPEAQKFIGKVKEVDWDLVDELYEEWTDYRQLAELCGVPSWYIEKRTRHLRRINPKRTKEPRHDSE